MEMKEERQGLQGDRHLQKSLDMSVTEFSAASCGTIGAGLGAGLEVIGRLGVQRIQAPLGFL